MKRTLLVLLLVIGSMQLRAQRLILVKPDIKLTNDLQNTFKPNIWLSSQALLAQPNNNYHRTTSRDSVTIYSTMPVAKVSSDDRMPVSGSHNNNMVYTMPVVKVGIVNPLTPAKRQQP